MSELVFGRYNSSINTVSRQSSGNRINWFKNCLGSPGRPVGPLLVICTYIPHNYRKEKPFTTNVIVQLTATDVNDFLSKNRKLKSRDCVILMGDLNCEFHRTVANCTGKWFTS